MTDTSRLSGGRLPTNRISASNYNPTAAGTTDFPVSYPIGTPVVVPQGPDAIPGSVIPGSGGDVDTSDVIGLCANPAVVGDPVIVQMNGPITLTVAQWDRVVPGQSGGLTQGTTYYLSSTTPGSLTPTLPVTGFVKKVGIALSAVDFLIDGSVRPIPA